MIQSKKKEWDFQFFIKYLSSYCQELSYCETIINKLTLNLESFDFQINARDWVKHPPISIITQLQQKILNFKQKVQTQIKENLKNSLELHHKVKQSSKSLQELYLLAFHSNTRAKARQTMILDEMKEVQWKINELNGQILNIEKQQKQSLQSIERLFPLRYYEPCKLIDDRNERINIFKNKYAMLQKQLKTNMLFMKEQEEIMVERMKHSLQKMHILVEKNNMKRSYEEQLLTFKRASSIGEQNNSLQNLNEEDEERIAEFGKLEEEVQNEKHDFMQRLGKKVLQDAIMTSSYEVPIITPIKISGEVQLANKNIRRNDQ